MSRVLAVHFLDFGSIFKEWKVMSVGSCHFCRLNIGSAAKCGIDLGQFPLQFVYVFGPLDDVPQIFTLTMW